MDSSPRRPRSDVDRSHGNSVHSFSEPLLAIADGSSKERKRVESIDIESTRTTSQYSAIQYVPRRSNSELPVREKSEWLDHRLHDYMVMICATILVYIRLTGSAHLHPMFPLFVMVSIFFLIVVIVTAYKSTSSSYCDPCCSFQGFKDFCTDAVSFDFRVYLLILAAIAVFVCDIWGLAAGSASTNSMIVSLIDTLVYCVAILGWISFDFSPHLSRFLYVFYPVLLLLVSGFNIYMSLKSQESIVVMTLSHSHLWLQTVRRSAFSQVFLACLAALATIIADGGERKVYIFKVDRVRRLDLMDQDRLEISKPSRHLEWCIFVGTIAYSAGFIVDNVLPNAFNFARVGLVVYLLTALTLNLCIIIRWTYVQTPSALVKDLLKQFRNWFVILGVIELVVSTAFVSLIFDPKLWISHTLSWVNTAMYILGALTAFQAIDTAYACSPVLRVGSMVTIWGVSLFNIYEDIFSTNASVLFFTIGSHSYGSGDLNREGATQILIMATTILIGYVRDPSHEYFSMISKHREREE